MVGDEDKVAIKISKLISDVNLDIEQVGLYIGRMPNVNLHRLEIIAETARAEKEDLNLVIDNDWRQVYNRTMEETTFSNKCSILSELWLEFRDDENFTDFIEYNDLGLPLAYAIGNDIVVETDSARKFVEEAFDLLLGSMGLEDTGYETLDDILFDGTIVDDPNEQTGTPLHGEILGAHTFLNLSSTFYNDLITLRQLQIFPISVSIYVYQNRLRQTIYFPHISLYSVYTYRDITIPY